MPITLQDAIDHLYDLTVRQGKAQSPARLAVLADYCIEQLAARGVHGVQSEQSIPGGGRSKAWDVAWKYDGKYRLAISLKSILKNLAGTVPNRIDDLMGEAANVQLHSPGWTIGTVEAFAYAEVDFSQSALLLPSASEFDSFFDVLVEQVKLRNPNASPDEAGGR